MLGLAGVCLCLPPRLRTGLPLPKEWRWEQTLGLTERSFHISGEGARSKERRASEYLGVSAGGFEHGEAAPLQARSWRERREKGFSVQ